MIKNELVLFLTLLYVSCSMSEKVSAISTSAPSNIMETDSLDAVIAAPHSHIVLLENDEVRVLRVVISPGEKEPMHHHKWKSVMYVEQPSRIKYYNAADEAVFTSPNDQVFADPPHPNWMEPEGVHAVENIDTLDFVALRVELKR